MPYEALAHAMSFDELNTLVAPHAATLFINGGQDSIIDGAEEGRAVVRRTRATLAGARQISRTPGWRGLLMRGSLRGPATGRTSSRGRRPNGSRTTCNSPKSGGCFPRKR